MRKMLLLLPFLLLFFLLLPAGAQAAAPTLEVSGWIPYWRTATGTADALAHLTQFTEINPFVYIVQPDGSIKDAGGMDKDPWLALTLAAKAQKVRVVPTVMWSDTAAMHTILSHTASRIALEDRITALAKANNYDGIDIDFEGKRAADKDYFSTFLKGLYSRMGKLWVMCTIETRTPVSSRYTSTPPPDATVYANDYIAINKYCDRVRLMTYDQGTIDVRLNAARVAPYIPVADPGWVEKVVDLAAQQISKKKLQIGIATYGYEYTVTKLSESGYCYDLQWAFNPRYGMELAAQLGLTPMRNSSNELSFMYTVPAPAPTGAESTPAGSQASSSSVAQNAGGEAGAPAQSFNIVWWSDAVAIKDKVDLAKKLGVRGVAVFKIDGGEDPAMWNILK